MKRNELKNKLKELINEAIECYPVDLDKDLLELLLWFLENADGDLDELTQVPCLIDEYIDNINDEIDIEFKELLQKIRELMDVIYYYYVEEKN